MKKELQSMGDLSPGDRITIGDVEYRVEFRARRWAVFISNYLIAEFSAKEKLIEWLKQKT